MDEQWLGGAAYREALDRLRATGVFQSIVDYLGRELPDLHPAEGIALDIASGIPDNWAKVDGEWHQIPDEHFVTVEQMPDGAALEFGSSTINWIMEHSLPCRVRGMADCPVQEVWEDHLEAGGHWPVDGRYRLILEGDFIRSEVEDAHGVEEVVEDGRTIRWEAP